MTLKGGLMYAGVDGYPTRQGKPLNDVAPRGGFAWSVTEQDGHPRRLRPLLGAAQITDIGESAIGARGYSASTTLPGEHRRRPDAGRHALESVPGRHHAAAGQLARPRHRRRQRHRLRRPGLEAGLRAAVLARLAARAAGRDGDRRRLHGQPLGAAAASAARATRRSTSTSSIRSIWRSARRCSRRCRIRSSGTPAFGNLSRSATIARGQLLRPFPQFDNVLDAPRQRGAARATTRSSRAGPSGCRTATRSTSTTRSAGSRTTSSARATRFSNRQGSALEQLRPRRGVRRVAARRRAPAERQRHVPAAVRRGPQVADERRRRRAARRLDGDGGRAAIRPASR